MTQQIINIGVAANDRSGDPIRTAFNKVNSNFTEIYTSINADIQIPVQTNNGGKFLTTNGSTLTWGSLNNTGNVVFIDDSISDANGIILENSDLQNATSALISIPSNTGLGILQILNLTNSIQFTAGAITGTSAWTFNGDGSITFPDNTTQTTAYTSSGINLEVDGGNASTIYTAELIIDGGSA